MAGDFKPQPRKKTPLDNNKLHLRTKNQDGKFASLQWGLFANNPRITVFTNVESDRDKNYGKISANMDTPAFFAFIEMLKAAINFQPTDATPEYKNSIENKNYTFYGGKRSDRPQVQSELFVGKDKEGVVWVGVMAENRPRLKFEFTLADFHQLKHGTGESFSASEASIFAARSYVTILEGMFTTMQVTHWIEPEEKPRDGNRGGYNNNRNNDRGNQGGSSSSNGSTDTDLDSDLPF